jgi:hypothetical protein
MRLITARSHHIPLQSPVEVRKKPEEQAAHAVPLEAVVKPGLHAHCPFVPQTPLRQLQVEGALATVRLRHWPVPVIPWSHFSQPSGQGLHWGPKNPSAHDSQEDPVNPGEHWQVPEAEQTPELEHGGEHALDWISTSVRPEALAGSWVISGTESHMMSRLFEGPEVVATQTFEDSASERPVSEEELKLGVEGRELNSD